MRRITAVFVETRLLSAPALLFAVLFCFGYLPSAAETPPVFTVCVPSGGVLTGAETGTGLLLQDLWYRKGQPEAIYWGPRKAFAGMLPISIINGASSEVFESYCVGILDDLTVGKCYPGSEDTVLPAGSLIELATSDEIAYIIESYPMYPSDPALSPDERKLRGAAIQLAIWKLMYGSVEAGGDHENVVAGGDPKSENAEDLANTIVSDAIGKRLLTCSEEEVDFHLDARVNDEGNIEVLVSVFQKPPLGEPVPAVGTLVELTVNTGAIITPPESWVVDETGFMLVEVGPAGAMTISAKANGRTLHWLNLGANVQPLVYSVPCTHEAEIEITLVGCPRTIGFWKHQVDPKTKNPQVSRIDFIDGWLLDGLLAPLGDGLGFYSSDFAAKFNLSPDSDLEALDSAWGALVEALWIDNQNATMEMRMRQQLTAVLLNIAYGELQINSLVDTGYPDIGDLGITTLAGAFLEAYDAYDGGDPEKAKTIFDNINNLCEGCEEN